MTLFCRDDGLCSDLACKVNNEDGTMNVNTRCERPLYLAVTLSNMFVLSCINARIGHNERA